MAVKKESAGVETSRFTLDPFSPVKHTFASSFSFLCSALSQRRSSRFSYVITLFRRVFRTPRYAGKSFQRCCSRLEPDFITSV